GTLLIPLVRKSLRQASSGKEEETRTRKPFIVTLRVSNPARPGLAKQPEASLAWSGVILTAKRRQPVPRLCDPVPKSTVAGAFVVDLGGGHVGRAAMAWHARSYRGPRTRPRDIRVAGNLGDPADSTNNSGSGTGTPTPRCPRPCASVAGSKQGARVVPPSEG